MGGKISQGITTTQFFVHGKRNSTRTGWEKHSKKYTEGEFENATLNGKNCLITGANSGIGFKLSELYAEKGANLFMVCRDPTRGENARKKILEKYPQSNIQLLVYDCSLKSSMK